jgi:zinc transporter ZupT
MNQAMSLLITWNSVIVLAVLVGGILPLLRSWSERALHLFIALATGVFLGAVFLHLLPELLERRPPPVVGMLVPLCIFALFTIERIVIKGDGRTHAVVGHATLIGLVIHSLAGGFGLAVGGSVPELQMAIFLSILGHKTVEAFSLATVLLLAGRSHRQVALLVGFLALMTPAGCLLGVASMAAFPGGPPDAPMAIATGTFLYVALFDLMPEVLHHRQDLWPKAGLIILGLVFMGLLRGHH